MIWTDSIRNWKKPKNLSISKSSHYKLDTNKGSSATKKKKTYIRSPKTPAVLLK